MKRLFMAGLMIFMLALIMKLPARAQTYTFDVPANPPSPATGSYHVVFTETSSSSFNVTVKGNYDGTMIGNDLTQKHAADSFTFSFFDSFGNLVNVTAGSGGVTGGTEVGDPNISPQHTYTAGAWVFTPGLGTYKMDAPALQNSLSAFGYNTFSGSVALSGAPIRINMSIVNASQQWFVSGLVPEASSVAMLVPGLLPLGLLLRRKRLRT